MNAPILSLDRVQFRYNLQAQDALQEVSFDIFPGSVTAILGPNGAGKTTLLHVILGFLAPAAGKVVIGGRPAASFTRPEYGRWVALVPQSEHLPFDFSVLEYVLLGRAPYLGPFDQPGAEDTRLARDLLDRLGIAHLEQRPVTRLSGGELQLVLVARALVQQPRLLLLDEPTAHLDLANKHRILGVMKTLSKQGMTVLFTTHDPNAAAQVAGSMILMRQGAVLDAGTIEQVFTAEKLSAAYQIPIEIVQVDGRRMVYEAEALA